MAGSVAAYPFKVYWKATSAAVSGTDLIYGVNDTSFAPKRDMLDTTAFLSAATGAKTRIAGLIDIDMSVTADLNLGDTVQNLIRTDCDGGVVGYLTVVFDPTQSAGSQGWNVGCLCESYEVKGAVAGKAETTFKFTPVAIKTAI